MCIRDRKYIIVYNGELYNTEDLRKELLEENYTFEAYCDTEVLLTAYIAWGINVVNKLNGIFAFAIYDEDKKQVFLARDPMGVKPLFYSKKGSKLIFGSEIKTILAPVSYTHLLDNGLKLIYKKGNSELSSIAISLDAGATRDGKVLGVAHVTEHMVYKGTEIRSEQQINEELSKVFGFQNAMTNYPYVVFYGTLLNEELYNCLLYTSNAC